ncbi:hypothetical protein DUNSADRAFT_2383 [Dunaliella salina]|uniref:Helicase C-terminal domain-containing protein n=1 Tax=Dunaliella salina TaxID=3046 RepID=A0ABQ7GVP5_DUNSA|nr:hypothetical protein DUNSADRAFT_2383 [Dunaliella salina]|eukprot:KAF5838688.1 hypothetical protein DUNSADRAFT_2383 [Dunaliella salina]
MLREANAARHRGIRLWGEKVAAPPPTQLDDAQEDRVGGTGTQRQHHGSGGMAGNTSGKSDVGECEGDESRGGSKDEDALLRQRQLQRQHLSALQQQQQVWQAEASLAQAASTLKRTVFGATGWRGSQRARGPLAPGAANLEPMEVVARASALCAEETGQSQPDVSHPQQQAALLEGSDEAPVHQHEREQPSRQQLPPQLQRHALEDHATAAKARAAGLRAAGPSQQLEQPQLQNHALEQEGGMLALQQAPMHESKKHKPNTAVTQRQQQRMLRDALAALSSVDTAGVGGKQQLQRWQGAPSCPADHNALSTHPSFHQNSAPLPQQLQQLDVRPAIHLKQPGLVATPPSTVSHAGDAPSSAQSHAAQPLPTALSRTGAGTPPQGSYAAGSAVHATAASAADAAGSTAEASGVGTVVLETRPKPTKRRRDSTKDDGVRIYSAPGPSDAGAALAPAGVASRFPPAGAWKEMKAMYGAAGTPEDEARDSPMVEMAMLLAEMMQHGLKTIAFCKTRKLAELVSAYTRETLKVTAPHLTEKLKVYRGGYSPEDRRAVEGGLHSGRLLAVAATNALELGIDVGALDATLHLGFPGSIASLRQQAGRAGRRGCPSLSILISFDSPLDQHFMRHPGELFGKPIESAQVDTRNPRVLASHLVCAAAEMPLDCSGVAMPELHPQALTVSGARDAALFGAANLWATAQSLLDMGLLGRHPHFTSAQGASLLHYSGAKDLPAAEVSLRSIDDAHIDIVLEGTKQVIERAELSKAFFQVYDGAVYLWQGRTYLCKSVDLTSMVAIVKPADLKYYTKVQDYTDIHVTGGRVAYPTTYLQAGIPSANTTSAVGTIHPFLGSATPAPAANLANVDNRAGGSSIGDDQPACTKAICEQAVVTVRFMGYYRVWQGSGRVFDSVDLWLPDVRFETQCDNPYDTRYRPERIIIYDNQAGGIGIAQMAAPLFPQIMDRALSLVEECICAEVKGCPSCCQHLHCRNYNTVVDKHGALVVLRHCLGIVHG